MAYTNFQNCTQQEYTEIIYSGDSKNKLKVLFNGVDYTTINVKSESLKVTSNILSSGNERFSLDNFVSKDAELIIHDINESDIIEPINISIGTLVDEDNNTYEYVPIGVFKLSELPTTDSGKTTIKMKDYSTNFDIPYSAQQVIEDNGGEATMLQILEDICDKCNVELGTTEFVNMNKKVSVWDNSINARVYVMYIAEKAGCIATMSRDGKLILVDLQRGEDKEVTSVDNIIYINDALPRLLNSLELQGNTYQQTYTGKNLLKNTSTNSGDNNYWSEYSTFDETTRTLTRSTSGTTEQFILHKYNLKNNTKYTVSFDIKHNGYVKSAEIFVYNSTASKIYNKVVPITTNFVRQSFTFTTNSSTDFTNAAIRFDNNGSTQSGTNATLTVKDVMLVEGEDNEFEPYVGGVPSPNPDYPQAIQNVTGRQTIDVVGKNLFDGELELGTYDATTGNKLTNNNIYRSKNKIRIQPSTSYTLSINGTSQKYVVLFYDKNNQYISQTISLTTGTFTTLNNAYYIAFRCFAADFTSDYVNLKIQLEKGTTASEYEEYKGQSYEINLGKNLFDKDNANELRGTIDASNLKFIYDSTSANYCFYIPCQSNTTYTIQKRNDGNTNRFAVGSCSTQISTSEDTNLTKAQRRDSAKTITITTGENDKYLLVQYYRSAETTLTKQQLLDSIQIEVGSTATSYSSYFTPIELNKIGDYKDSIKKSTGKNLFDKDNDITTGKTYSNDGSIINLDNGFIQTSYISVDSSRYYTLSTIKDYHLSVTDFRLQIIEYDENKDFIKRNQGIITTATTSFSVELSSTTKYVRLGGNTDFINEMQFEQNNQATTYEPYGVGKWYKYSAIGKVVLDGTENWYSNGQRCQMTFASNQYVGEADQCFSNYFKSVPYGSTSELGICMKQVDNKSYLQIPTGITYFGSVANCKTWLSTHNTEVYYVLSTPTITEITNNELIEQLESIELLKGENNITITSEDLSCQITMNYQSEKEPYELNYRLIEKYVEGEKVTISRVVYEDAIRKFEYGDESNGTLYINSANPYIIEDSEIENIYRNVRGLNLYSMKISKIIGNPAIDAWDICKFTYNDKEYKFLGQNVLTYTKNIIQSFDTQIGTNAKSQENVTINSESSQFKRVFTRINQAEGNIELNTSQITNVQSELESNYYTIEQSNQLIQNASTGITNTFSEAGGNNIFRNTGLWFEQNDNNNPYEFWNGIVLKASNEKASNNSALLLQNGTLYQEQEVPNGNYTISFKYKKLITLADVKVKINDVEFELDQTTDTEFQQAIEVNSQHINIQFITDTNNSCEIYDLMVNAGSVKLAYSQNQNETTTDTVNISKGITITSSDTENVVFKANADGVRIFEKNNMNTPKTKFTDKGTETNYLKVEDEAIVVDILIQRVGNQTWLTKI